jgi:GTP-dependent phosphoenolpyruvate carboxykinase
MSEAVDKCISLNLASINPESYGWLTEKTLIYIMSNHKKVHGIADFLLKEKASMILGILWDI